MKHRKNDLFKKFLIVCIDVALIVASLLFAYIITKESVPNTDYASVLIWFLGNIALVVFIYKCSGLYSIIFNSASIIDALRLCFAIFSILVANIIYVALIGRDVIGFSTCFVYASFLFLFTGLTRFYKRAFNVGKYYISTNGLKKKRVMIVGAGKSGAALIAEMQTSDKTDFVPVRDRRRPRKNRQVGVRRESRGVYLRNKKIREKIRRERNSRYDALRGQKTAEQNNREMQRRGLPR